MGKIQLGDWTQVDSILLQSAVTRDCLIFTEAAIKYFDKTGEGKKLLTMEKFKADYDKMFLDGAVWLEKFDVDAEAVVEKINESRYPQGHYDYIYERISACLENFERQNYSGALTYCIVMMNALRNSFFDCDFITRHFEPKKWDR